MRCTDSIHGLIIRISPLQVVPHVLLPHAACLSQLTRCPRLLYAPCNECQYIRRTYRTVAALFALLLEPKRPIQGRYRHPIRLCTSHVAK